MDASAYLKDLENNNDTICNAGGETKDLAHSCRNVNKQAKTKMSRKQVQCLLLQILPMVFYAMIIFAPNFTYYTPSFQCRESNHTNIQVNYKQKAIFSWFHKMFSKFQYYFLASSNLVSACVINIMDDCFIFHINPHLASYYSTASCCQYRFCERGIRLWNPVSFSVLLYCTIFGFWESNYDYEKIETILLHAKHSTECIYVGAK